MRTELIDQAASKYGETLATQAAVEDRSTELQGLLETLTADELQEYARRTETEAPKAPVPLKSPIVTSRPTKRRQSRADRWSEAHTEARKCYDEMVDWRDRLMSALSDLRDVQSEYEEWKDNLTDGLRMTAMGEKLETVCSIDLEPSDTDIDAMDTAISEAEGADLPLGFGRD